MWREAVGGSRKGMMEGDRDVGVWLEGAAGVGGGVGGLAQPKIATSHVCCVRGEL